MGYGKEETMQFKKRLNMDYKVEEETESITSGKTSIFKNIGNRKMNALLLKLSKIMVSVQVSHDNEAALTGWVLSEYSAVQIADFMNAPIKSKAIR